MTSNDLEKTINEIKSELSTFEIKPINLAKFNTNDKTDVEHLGYVNGVGGTFFIKFLALLTKKLQPKNIVELGNREGLSTLALYDQLPADARFTTIDIIEDVRYCPKEMFSDSRVSFITGDVASLDVLKKVPDKIDLLFTDTIHFYFQLKDEIEIYQHLLADVAIVAIDDIHTNDKGRYWEEINHPKWDLTEVCHLSGWGLFLFERKQPKSYEERWDTITETTSRIWERKYFELFTEKQNAHDKKIISKLKQETKKYPALRTSLIKMYYSLRKLAR